MKTKLSLVQLHNNDSLFFAGKNFGEKLTVGLKNISELYYDTDDGHVHVICEGQEAMIKGYMSINRWLENTKTVPPVVHHPMTSSVPVRAQVGGPNEVLRQIDQTKAKFTAQVETPHDKVQGKPGRKPKFQGQET